MRPDASTELTPDDWAGQLRRAFRHGELTAHYQPQYDLKNMRVTSLEALCRWRHPQHGLLLPERFIDVAERYGLISDVGRFMLDESGRRAADWHRRGLHVGVAINVSPSELEPDFAAAVLGKLRTLDLPHRALTVEITESPAITYSRSERTTLAALIDGGVGVSIDDFGSGNTSLDLIRRLPLTEIKIDRSLVQAGTRAIDILVDECVEIARDRDATVVAEGIETEEHLERARHWGADRGQGYYFSPPLPREQVEPLLYRLDG